MRDNALGDAGAVALSTALSSSISSSARFGAARTLTRLNLCDNEIGATGGVALAAALAENRVLTHVDLAHNNLTISSEAVAALTAHVCAGVACADSIQKRPSAHTSLSERR